MSEATADCAVSRRPMRKAVDLKGSGQGISRMQIKRIVAALEAESPEEKIAERERVSVRIIRKIRSLELDRRKRQMNAVGVAVGTMFDQVRHLHRDIDKSFVEEVTEGAA